MKVSKDIFKKSFKILLIAFVAMFLIEVISFVIGHPVTHIHIEGINLESRTVGICLLRGLLAGSFLGSFFNFFATVKMIKLKMNWQNWPVVAVVLMTILFPVEIIISMAFVVPNIIIFGLKGVGKRELN